MDWKIIDLSEKPAALNVRYDQLIIKSDGMENSVPLEELAVLIIAHPAVSLTQAVLNGICSHNASLIVCDDKKQPAGQIIPLTANTEQTERIAAQMQAGPVLKKQLWAQVVRAKVSMQATLLKKRLGSDWGLGQLARKVVSGDTRNIEAQASRRYWPALFGDDFRRLPQAGDNINSMLNYGYAIIRSMTARALCASGLHPSIGIHHHNRYDPFCLADDIMEPYRPISDGAVLNALDIYGRDCPLKKNSKKILLESILETNIPINNESREVFDAMTRSASSLTRAFMGKNKKLVLPYEL